MRKILLITFIFMSCSSRQQAKNWGRIAGTIIFSSVGASIGNELSPNKESKSFNRIIGGVSGGIGGYLLGNYLGPSFYEKEQIKITKPDFKALNRKLKDQEMIGMNESYFNSKFDFKNLVEVKRTNIKISNEIKKSLKGKLRQQQIIEYKIPAQKFVGKNGITYFFQGGSIFENRFIDLEENLNKKNE